MFDDILGEPMKKKYPWLLPNNQYKIRLTRLYYPKPKTEYEGLGSFHIQRIKNGKLSVLAIKDADGNWLNWAEYSHHDRCEDGAFVCEDYQLEILEGPL
jgi:hypothetical protein